MVLSGKNVAEKIMIELSKEVKELKQNGVSLKLAVVMVGNDPASKIYINNKKKSCEAVGIDFREYTFAEDTSEEKLVNLIEKLNSDKSVSGILVQLPLPSQLNSKIICEKIDPAKDVDGFTFINTGKLMQGISGLLPCTPLGIIEIIKYTGIKLEGKHCIVLGRSDIVGKPTAMLLLQNNATVTICHSKTKNIDKLCKEADVIVSAVGKANFLTKEMIKKGVVVIDVGINRDTNGKLCGDVDFKNVEPLCSMITPVPGGVGPVTIAMLIKNTVKAAKLQNKN